MFYLIGKYEHLFGYNSKPFINSNDFHEKFDTYHFQDALERIENLNILNINQLVKLFNQIEYNFNDLEINNLTSFNNPIYYKLLNIIHDNNDDVKLSNFYYIRKQR